MRTIESSSIPDLDKLPATINLPAAGRFFGLGRDASYELHRRGEFPTPVLRLGKRLVVTKASLCAALGVDMRDPQEAGDL